eukprot:CAMPEP_0170612164 /NCGR_PEP_ID=MMETSP0224-20130122/23576_1 /TAXON_ID=285029 /ORGANISM="Togula jolla, Strain CCCM 725" /LENGTH=310 /DNA_ID=CAMNT_0010937647 /DNA_START=51 /DNA_END=983 /DNA_ORIENTATION=+
MADSRMRSRALGLLLAACLVLCLGSWSFVSPRVVLRPGTAQSTAVATASSWNSAGASSPVTGSSLPAVVFLGALGALAALRPSAASASARKEQKIARQARGGEVASGSIVVIAGPPAAGKGTQCDKIKDKYGFVHISTGDILRENVKNGTPLGLEAKEYMDTGRLVPSALIVDLVKDRLNESDIKEKGCLLDGFPRAPDQAQAMVDAGIKVDKFLLIKVPDDTLVERGVGRRLDPETGDIYHLKFKPPPADIVDRLVHRSDDQEEKIRTRLQAFHDQIDGILPFFKDVAVEVDGTAKPDDVWKLIQKAMD